MKMINKDLNDIQTKKKILDIAEYVFAQKWFCAASIREITPKANSNVAAVN